METTSVHSWLSDRNIGVNTGMGLRMNWFVIMLSRIRLTRFAETRYLRCSCWWSRYDNSVRCLLMASRIFFIQMNLSLIKPVIWIVLNGRITFDSNVGHQQLQYPRRSKSIYLSQPSRLYNNSFYWASKFTGSFFTWSRTAMIMRAGFILVSL